MVIEVQLFHGVAFAFETKLMFQLSLILSLSHLHSPPQNHYLTKSVFPSILFLILNYNCEKFRNLYKYLEDLYTDKKKTKYTYTSRNKKVNSSITTLYFAAKTFFTTMKVNLEMLLYAILLPLQ